MSFSIARVQVPGQEQKLEAVLSRSQMTDKSVVEAVERILEAVRTQGDEAVFRFTQAFDGYALTAETLQVSQTEIDEAYQAICPELLDTLKGAVKNIAEYHEKQRRNSWMDVQPDKTLGQLVLPLSSVGVYVPGGRAAYPSSVLMNVLPAKVAGVQDIFMVTPPGKDGRVDALTLVAAKEAGVQRIFKVGGAQAIGALAFGTQSIPRVDKIVGPGNIYVANAKRQVFGHVGIDMIAGPSEVLVIGDKTANPKFVAADLLSQAEHDPLAAALLVTDCAALADAVEQELEKQLALLPKKDLACESLSAHGALIVTETLQQAFEVANRVAPEHLELAISDPFSWLGQVKNAGAVFLGHYTPEPVGDYWAGPNHVLPTSGTARFFSPLGVDDFIKKTSVISYTKEALLACADAVDAFAQAEGLAAHGRAVTIRKELEE